MGSLYRSQHELVFVFQHGHGPTINNIQLGAHGEVGYGKPPKHTRFKQGLSGNPNGRPRGTKNLKTDLMEELSERISLSEGGKSKKLSKQRALVKSLTAKAIKGDARAISILINLMVRVLALVEEEREVDLISEDDMAVLDNFIARQTGRSSPRVRRKAGVKA
jgi:hypothetical protein